MIPLRVEGVSKAFGRVQAVSDVSFQVSPGIIYGVIGPDGAGKTTLFRMIASLLLPDKGAMHFGDIDIVKDFRSVRRIIGYMPGTFSLYPDLSVEENLKFFARIFGVRIEDNYDLIRPVYKSIEQFSKRKAKDLSGGMKQKLALSCALVHRPQFLLLDEPTTGVDPVSRKDFWDGLIELRNTGLTILVSTAYMDEAGLCDDVSLMQSGGIMSSGKPVDLVDSYPAELWIVEAEDRMRIIGVLRNNNRILAAYPRGASVAFIPQQGTDVDAIWRQLSDDSLKRLVPQKTVPSIEDVFLFKMNRAEWHEQS